MKIAIMSAMHEEINRIIKKIKIKNEVEIGRRIYYEGDLNGHDVVLVFSHWGKVAAAITATTLINKFGVDKIIFTGVAGGIAHNINIGDIVIGKKFYQHDMDSSPMIPKYEIPLLKSSYIETNKDEITKAYDAAEKTIINNLASLFSAKELLEFNINQPKVIIGDIASGDEFVSNDTTRNRILNDLPSVICVEMEGAAVAQVCNDFNIPFVVIRTISDAANEHSPINFIKFIENIASLYSEIIIDKYFDN
jgi:adenosylhomocysteine nucleosidase